MQQAIVDECKRLGRRMNARRPAHRFVNRSFGASDIHRRLSRGSDGELSPQVRTRRRVEKVREQKQIELGCRIELGHLDFNLPRLLRGKLSLNGWEQL